MLKEWLKRKKVQPSTDYKAGFLDGYEAGFKSATEMIRRIMACHHKKQAKQN